LFPVLRGTNLYGDPRPWSATTPLPALLSFLNTTKYPASLYFPCRWYADLKARRQDWWLKYL